MYVENMCARYHAHKTSYDTIFFCIFQVEEFFPALPLLQYRQTDGVAFKSSSDLKSTCVLYIVCLQFHSVVQNCIKILN